MTLQDNLNDLSGRIYSALFIFYLLSTLLPSVLLNIYIRNRIRVFDRQCKGIPYLLR
jgi:hypothetical protein